MRRSRRDGSDPVLREHPPRKQPPSLGVRVRQGPLVTDGDDVIVSPRCMMGQDLHHNTSEQHHLDYKHVYIYRSTGGNTPV